MKKTIENKQAFFAVYTEQEYTYKNNWGTFKASLSDRNNISNFYNQLDTAYHTLKPISEITDEDALHSTKLLRSGSHLSEESRISQFKQLFETPNFWVNQTNVSLSEMLRVFDYLRSKGYLLPFRDITTDELIEFGWVKI